MITTILAEEHDVCHGGKKKFYPGFTVVEKDAKFVKFISSCSTHELFAEMSQNKRTLACGQRHGFPRILFQYLFTYLRENGSN